jgi:hypothetical protein
LWAAAVDPVFADLSLGLEAAVRREVARRDGGRFRFGAASAGVLFPALTAFVPAFPAAVPCWGMVSRFSAFVMGTSSFLALVAHVDSSLLHGHNASGIFALYNTSCRAFCHAVGMADQPTRSTVIPGMHYRNAPDAIEWLCRVFGFEKHAVYAGPGNIIMHAELTLGGGMIMLGSANETPVGTGRRTDAQHQSDRERRR